MLNLNEFQDDGGFVTTWFIVDHYRGDFNVGEKRARQMVYDAVVVNVPVFELRSFLIREVAQ